MRGLIIIIFFALAIPVIAGEILSSAILPPKKYKFDGNFDDWKAYETIETDTGIDWSNVVVTPKYDGIQIHQFYEDSDSNYLYLFFKFKPSLQERYDNASPGRTLNMDIGDLYIDTDANTNTGCTDFDTGGIPQSSRFKAGTSTIPGSEIQIYFLTGFYADSETNYFHISYEMKRWDATAKSFAWPVRTADSRDSGALIAHGADGVEVAFLLSDLQVAQGSRISLVFRGGLTPNEYLNRTTIQIR